MNIDSNLRYNLLGYLNYSEELEIVPKGVGIVSDGLVSFYTDGLNGRMINDHWEMRMILEEYLDNLKNMKKTVFIGTEGMFKTISVNIIPPSEDFEFSNEQIDYLVNMLNEIKTFNSYSKRRKANVSLCMKEMNVVQTDDIDSIIDFFNSKKKDIKKKTKNIFKRFPKFIV